MLDPLRAALESAVAGQYRIVRELGRGGMGAVFLAEDLTLHREVAIKILPPDLAINPTLRERFVREARLAASLSHPNIVHVHSVIESGTVLAIVMQYVDGETLSQRVARSGPYDAADCARLLQDTAWALGYAHGRGVVHRDIKPDNLLIERGTGRALLLDFGIARQERVTGLTEAGQSIGTPHYMSPEQAVAEDVDGRSDLYSLGCVGFFAATGRTVFVANGTHRLLMLHLTQAPPPVTDLRPEFPAPLAAVIARALSKDRADRFATGEAMAEAIGALDLRSREVAPLLRLFHQQTAQSIQALLTMGVMWFVLWELVPRGDDALRAVIAVLFTTMGLTIVTQSLDRVRFAVRQGFTAPDVDAAFESIADETARARELLLSDPVERQRIARRRLFSILSVALGVAGMPLSVVFLSRLHADGVRQFGLAATGTLLLSAMMIGLGVALWAMRPIRVTNAQRLAARFWMGRLGRAIFARAERRYKRELERLRAPQTDTATAPGTTRSA